MGRFMFARNFVVFWIFFVFFVGGGSVTEAPTVEGKNIGAPQNSEKHNKIQKTTTFLEQIKRPQNRPESIFFNENECNRRRKTRGIQK